jgi:hypothetical protein
VNNAIRLAAAIVFVSSLGLAPSEGWSQDKYKIKVDVSAAQTKYTYQHVLDVGDMPGHQVRMYEIQRTYGDKAPVYRGVRAIEEFNRGQSDMTNGNGRSWGYSITVLENGDKIYAQFIGTIWTVEGAGGTKQATYTGTGTYVGGTGEFKAIRGTNRSRSQIQIADGKVVSNQTETEGEFWFEK